jgi:hypothetical protein
MFRVRAQPVGVDAHVTQQQQGRVRAAETPPWLG